MPHETLGRETTFGYLSVVYSPQYGYFGGYLIVSEVGRPLEFHCTSPVRPSRAQEILYGATLQPYLVGEQIGGTLLAAARYTPRLILTDRPAAMEARSRTNVPMVYLLSQCDDPIGVADPTAMEGNGGLASINGDTVAAPQSPCGQFMLGSHTFQLPPGFERDEAAVLELLALLNQHVELNEPFGRIHEAIREAQRIGERKPEPHGQAA